MKIFCFAGFIALCLAACTNTSTSNDEALQKNAQAFLDSFNTAYIKVYTAYNEAQWASNIKIIEGDSTNAIAEQKAGEAFSNFAGSNYAVDKVQGFLKDKEKLTSLQAKQFEAILYGAGNYTQKAADEVKQRIKAETDQIAKLYGFNYTIGGKPVTTNNIDDILRTETNLTKRLNAWNTSKEVGKNLKAGLVHLRDLRNKVVQSLGYHDFFTYQVSEYGMTGDEMMGLCKQINRELYPLFRELHTYARYELTKKYKQSIVPDYLPAHWVPNRWSQDWSSMVDVKGINLDSILNKKTAQWIVEEGEAFYKSLGYPPLPQTFWEKSSLYPLPPGTKYKKNNHASAWHMDLQQDVRSLMSVEPNTEWFETVHHELGHIYYYINYTNDSTPPVLRSGANRAFHEGIGSMIGMAAMQKTFLQGKGLLAQGIQSDDTQKLLQEALNYIVFIPFATGTMTEFEHDLYQDNLPADQFNRRWWELAKKYQGIEPPAARGEEYCDAATKTHINDDAAQYYDYALSYVILFQLHDYISRNILKQDPHATNYFGNKEVGKFLANIMRKGATEDWRKVLKNATGQEISANAMVHYFEPLMNYLKEVNKGRKYTLPENFPD
ncbi:MAG: M2 family metallopeptidase [Ginsengibacter sp.]